MIYGGWNAGSDALREARSLVIGDELFRDFFQRHQDVRCIVPSHNFRRKGSYIVLYGASSFVINNNTLNLMGFHSSLSPDLRWRRAHQHGQWTQTRIFLSSHAT